ncbi:MAG TPA: hypothetical protein DCM68_03765 [Verrucomicrobia bacterium]|nr:hypothetical protein [Verrucomicrobiota bacterium]
MERLLLIIDPQHAFCRLKGSLAKAFGHGELAVIAERVRALESFLQGYPYPNEVVLVRSEYSPGQFTGGDLGHPFSRVCVPGNAADCEWCLSASAFARKRVVTKFEESAASAPGFLEGMQALAGGGLSQVLVAGFLTTSCVLKTALDLRSALPKSVEVGLLEGLTASRASSYVASAGNVSRHEAALRKMQSAGIRIIPPVRGDTRDVRHGHSPQARRTCPYRKESIC